MSRPEDLDIVPDPFARERASVGQRLVNMGPLCPWTEDERFVPATTTPLGSRREHHAGYGKRSDRHRQRDPGPGFAELETQR